MNVQYVLVIAVIVVMGWFAFGLIFNLRRGERLLKWMQPGLTRMGARTTFRWLGTSVAELVIAQANRPFRRLETLVVMAPRDVVWMVVIAALQGRRDTLIFRGVLSNTPLVDLELADPRTWTGRNALRQALRRSWESVEYHGLQLMAPRGFLEMAVQNLDRLQPRMEKVSPQYGRLSLRRTANHLELHIPFPDKRGVEPVDFFESLRDLAGAVAERG